jgi:hypothetical protein
MDDKIIVSNRSVLTAKYGAAGLVKIKKSVDVLIAADDKRGINSRLVYLDDAASMKKYKGILEIATLWHNSRAHQFSQDQSLSRRRPMMGQIGAAFPLWITTCQAPPCGWIANPLRALIPTLGGSAWGALCGIFHASSARYSRPTLLNLWARLSTSLKRRWLTNHPWWFRSAWLIELSKQRVTASAT